MSITFDGATKRIILGSGTVTLDVVDLYSRWKDWVLTGDNAKWPQAIAPVGGDPIDSGAGTSIPLYAFLQNGWKVRPQEANHTLNVFGGVLLVEGGGDPFVSTSGAYTVRINFNQPVQAITVSTGGGSGGPSAAEIAAAVWDYADGVELGLTPIQAQRLILAMAAGKISGAEGATMLIRGAHASNGTSKVRITATTDENGNRTGIVLDVSP